MQRKVINKNSFKDAKLEMLESYWDLRLADFKEKALYQKNLKMIEICKSIEKYV
jgi:hypothetical protein